MDQQHNATTMPLSVPSAAALSEVVIRYTRDGKTHQIAVLVEPEELIELDVRMLKRGTSEALHLGASDDVISVCKLEPLEVELL